jgi:hypothetical protein
VCVCVCVCVCVSHFKNLGPDWARGHTPAVLALRRLTQQDQKSGVVSGDRPK